MSSDFMSYGSAWVGFFSMMDVSSDTIQEGGVTAGARVGEHEGPSSVLLERLRRSLIARYGVDLGSEAHAEASEYAAANWDRISGMESPIGYLYRVGQSRLRRYRRKVPVRFERAEPRDPQPGAWLEPGLPGAIAALPEQQRVCLLLVVADEWTHTEVAELLDVSKATVQTHVDRAMRSIRTRLGADQ